MTPERPEDHADDAAEDNGILDDAVGVDTTSIDFLAGATAQVNLVVPGLGQTDDEADDDDIIGDEVAMADFLGEDDELDEPVDELPALAPYAVVEDVIEDAVVIDDEPVEDEPVHDVSRAVEAEVATSGQDAAFEHAVFEPAAVEPAVEPDVYEADVFAPAAAEPVEIEPDAYEPIAFEPAGYESEYAEAELVEPAPFEPVFEPEVVAPAPPVDLIQADMTEPLVIVVEPEDLPVVAEVATVADEAEAETQAAPEAQVDAEVDVAAGAEDVDDLLVVIDDEFMLDEEDTVPDDDEELSAVPTTRREAGQSAPAARARETERIVTPRLAEPELASKRFGEIETDRESADLLTADRLLDQARLVKPEPEGGWPRFMYSLTRGVVNLGDGKRAKARKELDRRIAAPLSGGARFVPVLSRKGGVGKTTITTLLGMALADTRDDRIIAIDANPDRGTLADRIDRPSGHTVRDLVRAHENVAGFNDISTIVTRDHTRLDVLASDTDPRVSEAFSDEDYEDVARIAAHYYSIVLTDTGTGIVHSVMGATLGAADQLVIVSGLSVDEARLASETLTWLETNGFRDQVRGAIVVLNNSRPGTPLVRASELESHFGTRVRQVVQMPYDPHIGTGSAIVYRDLNSATRSAARTLAAAVVAGLRGEAGAA